MGVTKALADENRARALMSLEPGELCVCQLIELLELAPSTVSRHMGILKQARLVEDHKQGRWVYYRLADSSAPVQVQKTLAWLLEAVTKKPEIRDDRKRLKEILKIDPETLCKQRCGK